MRPQLPLKIPNPRLVSRDIVRARQELQPDRIKLQSPQPEHPLQRNGKISAAFAIFCSKSAAEENSHASRIVILLACSSMNGGNVRRLQCAENDGNVDDVPRDHIRLDLNSDQRIALLSALEIA
jgi:hypothetical protein